MNSESTNETLVIVLAMVGFLVIAVTAVVVFFRTWKKEKKDSGRKFFD